MDAQWQGCSANKKGVGMHLKFSHLKQLQTHFEAKHEKGVGTPFPRVPATLHPCTVMTFTQTLHFAILQEKSPNCYHLSLSKTNPSDLIMTIG